MQSWNESVSDASSADTSRKTAPNSHTAPGTEPEDMCLQGALLNSRTTGQLRKKIVRTREPTEKSAKGHKSNHSFCTSTTDVSTVPTITNLMIVPRDNNTRPTPLAIQQVAQVFIKTSTNSQTHHVSHHKVNRLLASPHLHSQSLTHCFSIISNIHHQLTHNQTTRHGPCIFNNLHNHKQVHYKHHLNHSTHKFCHLTFHNTHLLIAFGGQ